MPSSASAGSSRDGGLPAALRGERADMHLVDDQLLARDPAPRVVGPAKVPGIDDFRGPCGPPVEISTPDRAMPVTLIETKTVTHATSRRQAPQREIAISLGLQRRRTETFDLDETSRQRGAQTRKWTPPRDCGSAPIGRRRTGAAWGEARCFGTEGLGGFTSPCRSSARPTLSPTPARAPPSYLALGPMGRSRAPAV